MKWDELSGNDDDGDRCNDHTDGRYRTTSFHRRFETAALLPQNPNPAWSVETISHSEGLSLIWRRKGLHASDMFAIDRGL